MQKASVHSKTIFVVLALPLLAVLPGCDWFSGDDSGSTTPSAAAGATERAAASDESAVLYTMKGSPVVTEKMIEDRISGVKDAHPELFAGQESAELVENLKCMIANEILMTSVIDRHLEDMGVKKSREYQKKVAEAIRDGEQKVKLEHFVSTIQVSDREARQYYDERKDMFIASRGGRKAAAVQFKDKEAADAFLGKVKDARGDIEAAAQDAGHEVKDFSFVHERSIGIEPELRSKIVAARSVPFTELFTLEDGSLWVVRATEEKSAEYAPFDDVKDQLRQMLQGKKAEEKMRELRKKYDVQPGSGAAKYKALDLGDGAPEDMDVEDMMEDE